MTPGRSPAPEKPRTILVRLLCTIITFYRAMLSHFLPAACRFTPSCSEYAAASLRKYGLFRGGLKSVTRILRCAPWSPGGIDEP